MKVLSVFGVEPIRIGGTETFARELSLQLSERGWDSVLCFQAEPPADVRCFLEGGNVTLEVLRDSIDLNWHAAQSLRRMIRRHRPEILHLHFTGFLGIYPWLARLCSVRKIFFTDQTSRPEGYISRPAPIWKKGMVRLINHPLTRVTCVSDYVCRCMTTLGVLPSDRYETIYNSVDLSRVRPDEARAMSFRRQYEIPADRIVVAQVSWIIPEKGIVDLLKAAQLVVAKNPMVQFVLVGEGAYREQYAREAQAMGLGDNITWTGLIKDPFAAGVYDAADIVCQVSRWEEAFGWVIAEAMAYGNPVIGTRVGGIPEVIAHEESGFLVDRGDAAAIADRILTLANDPEQRRQMGRMGADLVSNRFDLRTNVLKLIDLYGIDGTNR